MPPQFYLSQLHVLAHGHTNRKQLTPRDSGSDASGSDPIELSVILVILFSVLAFAVFAPNLIDRVRAWRAQRRVLRALDRAEADMRGSMEQVKQQEEGMERIFQSSVGHRVVETLRGKKPGYRGGIIIEV